MGRPSTGAWTCEGSKRIELSYLLKRKMLQKDKVTYCNLSWSDGHGRDKGNIALLCNGAKDDPYIQLIYTLTDLDGTKIPYNYKIQLTTVPSNLGKGEVFYFVCPDTGKRCRVLYKAYDHHKWKSRGAYHTYLYYGCQKSSKMDYANDRYWKLERKLEKMREEKHLTHFYNGRQTRKSLRMDKMWLEREKWDEKRWMPANFPLILRKRFQDL